jgi:hypothetical protein
MIQELKLSKEVHIIRDMGEKVENNLKKILVFC